MISETLSYKIRNLSLICASLAVSIHASHPIVGNEVYWDRVLAGAISNVVVPQPRSIDEFALWFSALLACSNCGIDIDRMCDSEVCPRGSRIVFGGR